MLKTTRPKFSTNNYQKNNIKYNTTTIYTVERVQLVPLTPPGFQRHSSSSSSCCPAGGVGRWGLDQPAIPRGDEVPTGSPACE